MENKPHTPTFTLPIPPPPPFALSCDLDPSCEVDIPDLADDEDELEAAALARATDPEGAEFLGTYGSIELYLRSQLEPEISRGCAWILDCLDYKAVQERFESDGSRLMIEHGHVYRLFVGLLLLITISATGCIFDARGIGEAGGGAESTTGAPCWDCDPYPDARERLTDASHGGGPDPGPEPDTGSSTGDEIGTTAGIGPESSTSSTSTGEGDTSTGTSDSTGGDLIPQGEFCVQMFECAPSPDAPYAMPKCFNNYCELFCKDTADCPPAQVCTLIEGWNYHVCK